ncbi:MAG: T9SS type A sorting domain-containing protein [Cyclobacteriaceae bacterium]
MRRFFLLFGTLLLVSWISQAQPSTQASNIVLSPVSGSTTSLRLAWTVGTGANKVVVVVSDITSTFTPSNSTTYAANTDFGAGADIGSGAGKSVSIFNAVSSVGFETVTNLVPDSEYLIQIFEYTGTAGAELYNISSALNNPIRIRYYTASSTFTVPAGVGAVTVQAWGAGGGGGGADSNSTNNRAGGGGAGGTYTLATGVAVTGTITVTVGNGGTAGNNPIPGGTGGTTTFASAAPVSAVGGAGGTSGLSTGDAMTGAGGAGAAGTTFGGGDGAEAPGSPGAATGSGAGGSSAGTGADGADATGTTAGTGIIGAGNGAAGRLTSGNGTAGFFPGGGGSGGWDNLGNIDRAGGVGGGGLVIVSFGLPSVVSATLNYGTGVLVVTCTENISAADPTKFHINDATGIDNVTLSASGVISTNTVTFTLTEAQRIAALAISGVTGGNGGAVVLDVDAGGITSSQGNLSLADDNNPVSETADSVLPTVVSVTSSTANDTYRTGEVIAVDVVFSEIVNATGVPQITIETNPANQVVNWSVIGSGTNTLTFNYTVQPGDGDNGILDIDYASTTALVPNGGTIRDLAGNDATLTLATPGAAGSLAANKDIKVDTQAPVVSSVTSVANPVPGAILKIGDQLTFTADIATTEAGLTIAPGTYNGRAITWSTGNGGDTYTATYTVTSTDPDHLVTPLQLTNVTATDVPGNTSGAVSGVDVTKLIDANAPTQLTVGAVTVAAGGTVVPGYYNISNTNGISITVPLTAGDGSLDNGSIQLQMRNVGLGFLNLGSAQTITNGDRVAGFKTIAINDATFTSHARYGNGEVLTFTAIVNDLAGNSTTWMNSATTITVDKSAPTQLTVTTLAATGGRSVNNYYNGSNTGLNVTVPLTGGDASLAGGSIQIQLRNTSTTFTNVANTGLVAIPAGPPSSQVVSISATDLEGTAGFAEGLASGSGSSETQFLKITAVVTDIAGNSTSWNESTTNIDVDQTPPGIVSNLYQVYADAGAGGRNVIQFRMTEPLTDHAASPAERAHNFAFVSADNSYGSTGISVGGGTTSGVTNDVKYLDNGATNSVDNSILNNSVIYVESKADGDVWSQAVGTRVQYVQLGDGNTTAKVMRDFAGNELGAFDVAVTTGTTTTIMAATNGVDPGPNLTGGTNDVVVFAFRLDAGISVNVTNITVNSTSVPAGKFSNFELWTNSGADNFLAATQIFPTISTTASTLDFVGVNQSHSTTPRYYYVVADVNDFFDTPSPMLQFSLVTSGVTVSTGGKTGSHTGVNYSFIDGTNPVLSSIILPDANPNTSGTVNFTLNFDENVTIANDLDFSLTGTAVGAGEMISSSGSGQTHTVTVSNINQEGTIFLNVGIVNGSIQDLAGNPLLAGLVSASYQVYIPEPVLNPTPFTIFAPSTTPTQLEVQWTDVPTYPVPAGYLITVERPGGTALVPTDGVPIADQLDLVNNTTGYLNVAQGIGTSGINFNNLLSGPTYTFRIYPYTNSLANIDYKTGSPATVAGATPTGAFGTITSSPTSSIIPNISSLTTGSFLPVSTAGTTNLFFFIQDDGATPSIDNAKTLFNQIVISKGPSNSAFNWDEVIEEAKFISMTFPGFVEEEAALSTNITASTITFSGLATGDERIGEVDDNEQKYYQLYIRLKNPLDNTNNIRSLIDGLRFEFRVDANTAFTYAAGSSTIAAGQIGTSESTPSANNTVQVLATELRFVQQPTTNTYIGNQMSPLVSIESTDANGNRDLNSVPRTVNFTSTGSMIPTSPILTSGITTASIVHNSTGTGLQLTALSPLPGPALTLAVSNSFDIITDNKSDIIYEGGSSPTDINYISYIDNPIAAIGAGNVQIAQFRMRDGGATHTDADGSPTILTGINFNVTGSANLERVALFNGAALLAEQAAAPTLSFSGFSLSTAGDGSLGPVSDAILTVRASFKQTPMAVTDNAQIGFTITSATTSAANNSSLFAAGNAGGATTPANPNNLVEVVASKYFFINPVQGSLSNSVLANVTLTTAPGSGGLGGAVQLEARDDNENLDVDYGEAVNITNTGNLPMTDQTNSSVTSISDLSFGSGVLTFRTGFKYDITGNGTLNVAAQTPGISIAPPTSPPITVSSSTAADIVVDLSGTFTSYNQNIEYINYQAANISPGNPSNPNPATDDEIKVAQFRIRDSGPGPNDLDLVGTELTSITFDVTNAQYVSRLALYHGNTELGEVALAGATSVSFGPFSVATTDNGSELISLFATFENTVTDNAKIAFTITSATANPLTSTFADPVAAGGAFTPNLANDDNKLEVVATQLIFTTPAGASISVPITPIVQVAARDINLNLDSDYNGNVTATSNTDNGNFSTLNDATGAFAGGLKTYPASFQFDTGNGNVQLTMNSGAGSGGGVNAGAISGTSNIISVLSSFESTLSSIAVPQNIDYENFQATNITGTGNGFVLDAFRLRDGGFDLVDVDGAPTVLDDLTIGISNPQVIRKIAIYQRDPVSLVTSEVAEKQFSDIVVANGYGELTFNNLNITAADRDVVPTSIGMDVLVLATFDNLPSTITDRDFVQIAVIGGGSRPTLGTGSKFAPDAVETGTVGGIAVTPAFSFPEATAPVAVGSIGAANRIQVTATNLDFVTQPSAFAGIMQPIDGSTGGSTGIVHARDDNEVLDTDFNFAPTVSAAATPVAFPPLFAAGVLDLTGMRYQSPGDGTLTVAADIISSATSAVPCNPVDVFHVSAVESQANGVVLIESLKGGSANQRIFGVTFQVPHVAGSEPELDGFSITFKNDLGQPYHYTDGVTTVFKNFQIFQSINLASPTTTAGILTVDEVQSERSIALNGANANLKDMVQVTFTAPAPLHDGNSYTYYLSVDVDVSVNVSTAPITPYLEDLGFSDPQTNDHILVSEGSSSASVQGITRKFASTKPPVLVSTNPFNGKLNVDPALNVIELFFDVDVVTFDGVAFLHERSTGNVVDQLTAINGLYVDPVNPGDPTIKDQTVSPLRFQLSGSYALIPDEVYYITIPKGKFSTIDPLDRAGISDEGFNVFGGISFNGTFYFKISSPNPPVLLSSDPVKYFYTPSAAAFNAEFDQAGTVHYMVVDPAGAPPTVTNNQILGIDPYMNGPVIERGSVDIDQFTPNFQYATVNANLTAGVDYPVYVFAQNDAEPTNIPTSEPYGSNANGFAEGANGPTLVLRKPLSGVNRINFPRYDICSNSAVRLEEPLIISELSNAEFAAGGTQSFNLVLPTGFQYDVDKDPTITLNGADFGSLPPGVMPFRYINTTLLEISFVNTGIASLDNIIITDLFVTATGSVSGQIRRFAGNGLAIIPDLTALAQITAGPAIPITFSNTYSEDGNFDLPPLNIAATVTYIPDNHVENGLSTVRLLPQPPPGDYGASVFTGSGLTDDILNLSAVPLNAPFNLTLTHTDQNGCISNTVQQYNVYDHTNAIPELLTTPGDIRISIENPNFPLNPDPMLVVADSVSFGGLAGFQLIDLYANVPPTPAGAPTPIIEFGTNWQELVKNIPVVNAEYPNALLGQTYKTYNWEYVSLLHDDSLNYMGYGLMNPYTFSDETTPQNRTFYRGGSLGKIEFTGKYQSTADFSVFIPFTQEVEIFIPAIPVVEVAGQTTTVGTTPYFCQKGNNILINGYPNAIPGASTGYFVLLDSVTQAVIYNALDPNLPVVANAGFSDNGNGSASLDPDQIFNNYETIQVNYIWQENISPSIGTGTLYIKITPNPVAQFTTSTLCEDLVVDFDPSSSTIAAGFVVDQWLWGFSDPNSLANSSTDEIAQHIYDQPGTYANVSLSLTSDLGCESVNPNTLLVEPTTADLLIGSTPEVSFTFEGVSTAEAMTFNSTSTIAVDEPSPLPGENVEYNWRFGDGQFGTGENVNDQQYALPDIYTVKLEVKSIIGCIDSLKRQIVMVDKFTPTEDIAFEEDFESGNGNWQVYNDPAFAGIASWAHGTPTTTVINTDTTLVGSGIWTTNLDGSYTPLEQSYLYTTCLDMTQLERPMISFNSMVQMEDADGVVLEYSIDNKNIADPTKLWVRLGSFENSETTGVDWYNALGLASKPGNQTAGDYGWSGRANELWMESKHTLDIINTPTLQDRVVFRFGIASVNTSPGLDGFALDNVRVGNRTRTIVVEHFTNKGNPKVDPSNGQISEKFESDELKTLVQGVGTELVKINYHVGFPEQDPFNLDNPAAPSARALYYNITETPLTRLDGFKNPGLAESPFSTWGQEQYGIRTLQLAQAAIDLTASDSPDGSLEVNVSVTPKIDLGANTVLHVAILEKNVSSTSLGQRESLIQTGETEFEYVLKRMLPNALGTRFNEVAPAGQVRDFATFNWYPEKLKLYSPENDIVVIAFLQNEDTKEILQSEIIEDVNDPPLVTGLDFESIADRIAIFPNPADGEVTVQLPTPAVNRIELQMVDQMGRVVNRSAIEVGEQEKEIYTRDMAAGIYLLQFGSGNSNTFKKVMVVHK